MEKSQKLRHIRVSNDGDVIPVAPPFYTQTGLNIHVYDGSPAYVGYNDSDGWLIAQIRPWSAGRHSLESYHKHFFEDKSNEENIVGLSVKDLYAKYAKIDV